MYILSIQLITDYYEINFSIKHIVIDIYIYIFVTLIYRYKCSQSMRIEIKYSWKGNQILQENVGTLKCWLQSKDWFNLVYNINHTTNIWYEKL